MPLVRVRNPNNPYFFSKSYYINLLTDTQMYLCSSAFFPYIDCNFSVGHISMDLSSVLAALSSNGVSAVTGTNIHVASRQGCTLGIAGPEP